MFYFMKKRPWKCRVVCFTFGTYVADQRELKRSLSRSSDDSFMTLILTWPTNTDVEQITHWFISPDMCFLQHAGYQCSFYLIQLPAYNNTIFLLGQSAQHLQLSDPTLASMTLFYMLVYCVRSKQIDKLQFNGHYISENYMSQGKLENETSVC